ncbi:hypothetical protein HDU93_008748 [Gonapodya sp. JEL0774]|nr:hypothetical protein HDU93_008748 [Gonapodya sp. JEL0774]
MEEEERRPLLGEPLLAEIGASRRPSLIPSSWKHTRSHVSSSVRTNSPQRPHQDDDVRAMTLSLSYRELSLMNRMPLARQLGSEHSDASSSWGSDRFSISQPSPHQTASREGLLDSPSSPVPEFLSENDVAISSKVDSLQYSWPSPRPLWTPTERLTVPWSIPRPRELALLAWENTTTENLLLPATYLPAVILGVLMNILDALSYGLIIFPNDPTMVGAFDELNGYGFLESDEGSYFGGSQNLRRRQSQMIEIMPFLYALVNTIKRVVPLATSEDDRNHAIIATTMVVYVLGTFMTGFAFVALGLFRLGNVTSFFPRHLLIGTVGGIGFFLLQTGIEVTADINFEFSFSYLERVFQPHAMMLWGSALGVTTLLQVLHRKIHHPLFIPVFYILVPIFFYSITFAAHIPIQTLRDNHWLFNLATDSSIPWYHFYSYYDIAAVNWEAVAACVPTLLALTFFGLLHVPINVPALAVSTGREDIDTNRELLAHGLSNLAAACFGTIQNYLVYSNSVLFIRSGGDSRIASFMLAVATFLVMVAGSWLVNYVPVLVVGSLIFHLGIDLMKEALVDTWNAIGLYEYLTILSIVISMGVLGFTEGVIDFSIVSGVDYSASEAFQKIKRRLQSRGVFLVVCGLGIAGVTELDKVGLFEADDDHTKSFGTLNNALEWCENIQLRTFYGLQLAHRTTSSTLPHETFAEVMFGGMEETIAFVCQGLRPAKLPKGTVIWQKGADSNSGLYFVESGQLVATIEVNNRSTIVETLVPGERE